MWPGKSALKFGAIGSETLNDGQANKIATFPTKVAGAAALFHLLYNSYVNMTLRAAIAKWSGGNHVESYLGNLRSETGIAPADVVTPELLKYAPTAIALGKAMAKHEAGRPYPMTDDEWKEAHTMAFKIPAADTDSSASDTPWVDAAIAALGRKEFPGTQSNNPEIIRDFALCGRADVKTDETPWCAAFAGARLRECNINIPQPKDALLAKKYLNIGSGVAIRDVRRGDLRIENRTSDPSLGHIEIVVDVDHKAGTCRTIAGNVNNSVAYATKPLKGAGYRRVTPGPKPAHKVVYSSPFRALLTIALAAYAAFVGAVDWVITNALWLADVAPDVVEKTGRSVSATQQVYSWFGLSPSTWVVSAIVTAGASSVIVALWKAERAK